MSSFLDSALGGIFVTAFVAMAGFVMWSARSQAISTQAGFQRIENALNKLGERIDGVNQELGERIGKLEDSFVDVKESLARLEATVAGHSEQLTDLARRIGNLEDSFVDVKESLARLEATVAGHSEQLERLSGHRERIAKLEGAVAALGVPAGGPETAAVTTGLA